MLYDNECPLCTFQMKLLTWLDWFALAEYLPISDPRTKILAPQLSPETLNAAMHCVTPEGTIHRGARCIRHLCCRMPLLFPLGLLLWIPGIIWIAEIVYRTVSRNRYLLSRLFGCKEACALLPERKSHRPTPPAYRP